MHELCPCPGLPDACRCGTPNLSACTAWAFEIFPASAATELCPRSEVEYTTRADKTPSALHLVAPPLADRFDVAEFAPWQQQATGKSVSATLAAQAISNYGWLQMDSAGERFDPGERSPSLAAGGIRERPQCRLGGEPVVMNLMIRARWSERRKGEPRATPTDDYC